MQLVKGNSRSTISTKVIIFQRSWYWITVLKEQIRNKYIASDVDLDHGKTSQEQVWKTPIHELRSRDKLTIPETYQRQTTMRLGYSPVSSLQMHGICSALGQAVSSQTSLWKIDVIIRISHTHSSSLFELKLGPTLPLAHYKFLNYNPTAFVNTS